MSVKWEESVGAEDYLPPSLPMVSVSYSNELRLRFWKLVVHNDKRGCCYVGQRLNLAGDGV